MASESQEIRERAIHRTETQCRVLGIDGDGWHHIYDTDRERVVVISRHGIDEQVDLAVLEDKDLHDWMAFVEQERGWLFRQWRPFTGIFGVFEEGFR